MKRRVRKIANFFAFNLLFFALYLNFIHKDKVSTDTAATQQNTAAFSGTVLVEEPNQFSSKTTDAAAKVSMQNDAKNSGTALTLSIN